MQPARTGLAIMACLASQIDKPLVGQVRLDDRTAAIAARHLELVVVDLVDETERVEVGDDLLARDIAIETAINLGRFIVDGCSRRENVDQWQLVALAERVVVEVMRSEEHTSDLQSLMRISYAVFCLTKKKL